ncbi:cytochrome P450 [Xylaria sp. CBS 124048]|nr:cytochrome P450 [Xylaria sp. CBS 124048]
METQQGVALTLGFLSGYLAHRGVFIHGEWHVQAPALLLNHALVFYGIFLLRVFTRGTSAEGLSEAFSLMAYGYLPALFTSILVYRVFFHRLTKAGFPGPALARTSKLWHVWQCRTSMNHKVLYGLREKYGDFVRTGPSEVAVFHPDVFMATDGPRSDCIKSEWYDLLIPDIALNTARDKTIHGARRRQWNRGFTSQALGFHLKKVLEHIDVLDKRIELDAKAHRELEVKDLLYWFGFDAMGDFVMGKELGMLVNQENRHLVTRLRRASSLLGSLGPAPWLVQLGLKLAPSVSVIRDWHITAEWCKSEVKKRLGDTSRRGDRDLIHYVQMEGSEDEDVYKEALQWVNGDSMQAIVAGSAPIANTLLGIITELGREPTYVEKVYEELESVDDISDAKALAKLPFLNACITETLRLSPALVTGGQRKTGEKGLIVAGTFIPPYTTIVAPQWVISRREDCFVKAEEFIPERWTTRPDLVLNEKATTPFGTGKYSCLGHHLAVDILLLVVARLVRRYTFEFAPGEKGACMTDALRDHFITNPGTLRLHFTLRKM